MSSAAVTCAARLTQVRSAGDDLAYTVYIATTSLDPYETASAWRRAPTERAKHETLLVLTAEAFIRWGLS